MVIDISSILFDNEALKFTLHTKIFTLMLCIFSATWIIDSYGISIKAFVDGYLDNCWGDIALLSSIIPSFIKTILLLHVEGFFIISSADSLKQ